MSVKIFTGVRTYNNIRLKQEIKDLWYIWDIQAKNPLSLVLFPCTPFSCNLPHIHPCTDTRILSGSGTMEEWMVWGAVRDCDWLRRGHMIFVPLLVEQLLAHYLALSQSQPCVGITGPKNGHICIKSNTKKTVWNNSRRRTCAASRAPPPAWRGTGRRASVWTPPRSPAGSWACSRSRSQTYCTPPTPATTTTTTPITRVTKGWEHVFKLNVIKVGLHLNVF